MHNYLSEYGTIFNERAWSWRTWPYRLKSPSCGLFVKCVAFGASRSLDVSTDVIERAIVSLFLESVTGFKRAIELLFLDFRILHTVFFVTRRTSGIFDSCRVDSVRSILMRWRRRIACHFVVPVVCLKTLLYACCISSVQKVLRILSMWLFIFFSKSMRVSTQPGFNESFPLAVGNFTFHNLASLMRRKWISRANQCREFRIKKSERMIASVHSFSGIFVKWVSEVRRIRHIACHFVATVICLKMPHALCFIDIKKASCFVYVASKSFSSDNLSTFLRVL